MGHPQKKNAKRGQWPKNAVPKKSKSKAKPKPKKGKKRSRGPSTPHRRVPSGTRYPMFAGFPLA